MKLIEDIKSKHSQNDEKINDIIKELVNIDFKQNMKHDFIADELQKVKEPLQRDMNNMLNKIVDMLLHTFNNFKYMLYSNDDKDFLKALGRTQKDYRKMLNNFYDSINNQDFMDSNLKSNVLNKTSQIIEDLENSKMKNQDL